MKTFGRILIILLAALLVVGAALAFVRMGGAQSLAFGRGEDGEFREFADGPRQFGETGVRPSFGDGGEFRGGERYRGGLFGLAQLFKSLIIVSAVVLIAAALTTLGAGLRRIVKHRASPPSAGSTPGIP